MAKDTITIGGQEFPTSCPENCPGKGMPFDQGGLCARCPIFNCLPKGYNLLEPCEYRKDWAKVWKEWFEGDMKEWPELCLERRKEDDDKKTN